MTNNNLRKEVLCSDKNLYCCERDEGIFRLECRKVGQDQEINDNRIRCKLYLKTDLRICYIIRPSAEAGGLK